MEKTKKLVIFGIGETGRMFYNCFQHDSEYEVCAFTVEDDFRTTDEYRGLPVVRFAEIEDHFSPEEYEMFVAIVSTNMNTLRKRIYSECKAKGYKLATYISSKASVGYEVEIGENCAVMENTSIQQFAKIGDDVIIFSNNVIGHSSEIRNHVFISSCIAMSGYCKIGESCFLGVNCTLNVGVVVGDYCYIGMATVIEKDVPDFTLIKAEPSKPYKRSTKQLYGLKMGE
jgi:sugar O-acyltransferase (sialic acid O-acetyltransferase NeuD family)